MARVDLILVLAKAMAVVELKAVSNEWVELSEIPIGLPRLKLEPML